MAGTNRKPYVKPRHEWHRLPEGIDLLEIAQMQLKAWDLLDKARICLSHTDQAGHDDFVRQSQELGAKALELREAFMRRMLL